MVYLTIVDLDCMSVGLPHQGLPHWELNHDLYYLTDEVTNIMFAPWLSVEFNIPFHRIIYQCGKNEWMNGLIGKLC